MKPKGASNRIQRVWDQTHLCVFGKLLLKPYHVICCRQYSQHALFYISKWQVSPGDQIRAHSCALNSDGVSKNNSHNLTKLQVKLVLKKTVGRLNSRCGFELGRIFVDFFSKVSGKWLENVGESDETDDDLHQSSVNSWLARFLLVLKKFLQPVVRG